MDLESIEIQKRKGQTQTQQHHEMIRYENIPNLLILVRVRYSNFDGQQRNNINLP